MSHKKKAWQNMVAHGMPKRRIHSSDAVQLQGDAECDYYWENGVLYWSERGSSTPVTKCDSPIKAESYVKRKSIKRK